MLNEFSITDYGAQADGTTLCTENIQQAIDACHKAGGGKVLLPAGEWLSGTIELKSNVELYLSRGCRLLGSTDRRDYQDLVAPGLYDTDAPEKSTSCLIMAREADNIAVSGPGEINGRGIAFYDTMGKNNKFEKPDKPRPRMLMAFRCRNIRLEDTHFIDAPCWTVWLMQSSDISVRGITVRGDERLRNNDGIDFDACRHVTVSDSIFETEDDCLVLRNIQDLYQDRMPCEHITVSNCILKSNCQGIRIGCPSDGLIRNCVFTNCVIDSKNNGIVSNHPKIYSRSPEVTHEIYNILCSHMTITCPGTPIKIDIEQGIELKKIRAFSFTDIFIESKKPCLILGSDKTEIEDITFNHVKIATSGEDSIICRNCRDVKLNSVTVSNIRPHTQE